MFHLWLDFGGHIIWEESIDGTICNMCQEFHLILVSRLRPHFFQAYTMELEAEVAKLKEENQDLQRKQVNFDIPVSQHRCAGMYEYIAKFYLYFCEPFIFSGRNHGNAEESGNLDFASSPFS